MSDCSLDIRRDGQPVPLTPRLQAIITELLAESAVINDTPFGGFECRWGGDKIWLRVTRSNPPRKVDRSRTVKDPGDTPPAI